MKTILKTLPAILALCHFTVTAIGGGDTFGNGGGYIENEIEFVWLHFQHATEACVQSSECATDVEKEILRQMQKQKQQLTVEFYDEETVPELKSKESQIRANVLQFNTTYLYQKFADPIHFSFVDAMTAIFRGLNRSNDNLAKRVVGVYFRNEKTVSFSPFGKPEIAVKMMGENYREIALMDGRGLHSISQKITKNLTCETPAILGAIRNTVVHGVPNNHLQFSLQVLYTCQNFRYSADILLSFQIVIFDRQKNLHAVDLNSFKLREKNRQQI